MQVHVLDLVSLATRELVKRIRPMGHNFQYEPNKPNADISTQCVDTYVPSHCARGAL